MFANSQLRSMHLSVETFNSLLFLSLPELKKKKLYMYGFFFQLPLPRSQTLHPKKPTI